MVTKPIDMSFLELRRAMLLDQIEKLVTDRELLSQIKQLAGLEFSLKGFFARPFGLAGSRNPQDVEEVRQRIALQAPGALESFINLMEVCKEIERKNNPLIVF